MPYGICKYVHIYFDRIYIYLIQVIRFKLKFIKLLLIKVL